MSENFPNLPEAIRRWCARNNSTQAKLAQMLGVRKSTVTRWAHGEEPEVKRIRQVADALGVTVAYLAGEEALPHTETESELLRDFRLILDEEDQAAVRDYIKALARKYPSA